MRNFLRRKSVREKRNCGVKPQFRFIFSAKMTIISYMMWFAMRHARTIVCDGKLSIVRKVDKSCGIIV